LFYILDSIFSIYISGMPTIHLTTFIAAPVKRVFDLSRSITLHKLSMQKTGEVAIAGTTSGLIKQDETVTWRAKHLFKTRFFTSKITEMLPFEKFTDKMIRGDFKSFEHEHFFKPAENGTIVIDILHFETPYGLIGKIVNKLYLVPYIEKLIRLRNDVIKQYATGEKWKALLQTNY
jgi:ligand-binding SRPBCC domain-containing protein